MNRQENIRRRKCKVTSLPTGVCVRLVPSRRRKEMQYETIALEGFCQLDVAGTQIGDLLYTSPGIEHRGQEGVVVSSFRSGPVDGFQNRVNLLPLQVVDGALRRAFGT